MNPRAQPGPNADVFFALLACVCTFWIVLLVTYIFFLLNLHRSLSEVDERDREVSPGSIWLAMIPVVGVVWLALAVGRISDSFRNAFLARGWSVEGEGFARLTGRMLAISSIAFLFLHGIRVAARCAGDRLIATLLSVVGLPLMLFILVCFIVYWVQVHQYKVRLREAGRGYRPGGVEEDYDDQGLERRDRAEYDRHERSGRPPDDGYDDYDPPRGDA